MPRNPSTPYLHVDVERLERNIRRVARWADERDIALRPHAKTHKSQEVADRQLAAGAVGLTVATIGEAEVFVERGVNDVFVAYPVHLDDGAVARLTALAGKARMAIGVDSVEGASRAGLTLGRHHVDVLVEVDCGHHRTGTRPEHAGAVARAAVDGGANVRGIFTFPGHSYAPDGGAAAAAADETTALLAARDAVEDAGLEVAVLSGGSTPSLLQTESGVVTEVRPGVYVFGDAQQWELGAMAPDDIALTCRATVVSHAGGRMVLDAGGKALAADRAPFNTGGGRLLDYPEARIVLVSEHHAVVDMAGGPLPALGSQVVAVPNHCCAAVNLAEHLWADERGALRPWAVVARGRNS